MVCVQCMLTSCSRQRSVKKQAGQLFGDNKMEAEGKGREMKGDAKKTANS